MCFTNDLTRILLLLLIFLLTTMLPTETTTTSAIAAIASSQTKSQIQQQNQQQQQQQQLMHSKSLAFLDKPTVEITSAGTQLLQQNDRLFATLVDASDNHKSNINSNSNHYHHSQQQQHQHNNAINMLDFNNVLLNEQQMGVEETTFPPPVFDFGMPRNITARSGQTAAINCRVDNLGDKSISWIRKRDLHILTAGILTYTSDERFKVIHTVDSKDWSLHVKYAQPRDSGIYECQVNTEPKISMAFRLNVIVTPPDAKAIITGPSDLYVKVGSAITLTCHVKQPSSAQDIGPIYWYRGPYILTPFVAHPNEASIDLQRISMESKLGEKLQSRLRIANAQTADSGNYTCMPTTADAASVLVNVINDESPAAMQKSAARGLHASSANSITIYATIIYAISFSSIRSIASISNSAATAVRWLLPQRQQQTGEKDKDARGSERKRGRERERTLRTYFPFALSLVHIICCVLLLQIFHILFSLSS